eukprot:m.90716 g.90716  ORF g.90716 m.90716 type:complete len:672 (-) comp20141_c0_seq2:1078-3093(-)
MDFTRCCNVCWRLLPKDEHNQVLRSEIDTLCQTAGINEATLEQIWQCMPGPTQASAAVDYSRLEVVLGLVSLAQQECPLDRRMVTPAMPPPALGGVFDGGTLESSTSAVVSFVANPNPWSTWTMSLDWQPPTYDPKALVLMPVDTDALPDDPVPTVDHSQWQWDPSVLVVGTGVSADDAEEYPEFPEPDFPRTNISAVDNQIRQGILDKLREQWDLERSDREVTQGKKHERSAAVARIKREDAVALVTAEATAALVDPDPLSQARRLNVVVAAARRLSVFLEPELSLTENIEQWDMELAQVEHKHFGGPLTGFGFRDGTGFSDRDKGVDSPAAGGDEGDITATNSPTVCTKCGGEVPLNDKFCPNCGTPATTPLQTPVKTDEWEIDRARVKLLNTIGEGEFGEVKKGSLDGTVDVAIKTAKKQVRAFLAEAGKMKKLKHRNIVELMGVCTVGEPALIVLEFARSGCVLDFLLKNCRKIQIRQQCSMCADVAAGLAYLLKTHWIHGDLAARNLLVGGDLSPPHSLVVKICDFGHAMQTDEYNTPILVSRQLAFRWTAPELYEFRRSSPETDVWSFGVVVYEILSGGRVPYSDNDNNKDVMKKIQTGWRMPREKNIWKQFYDMMLACWHKDPKKRPKPQVLYDCCKRWQHAPNLTVSRGASLQYPGGTLKFEY